jgi:hypothetical protein
MDRLKTFLIYTLIVIGFFIFSEFLINVSLNTTYKTIGRKDNLAQVQVYQAEATKVNGRLKGTIYQTQENPIETKYLQVDFYSARNVKLGTKYIEVENAKEEQGFELYFKLNNVNYYDISKVNEKTQTEMELLPADLTKPEIIVGTIFALLMFI